MADRKVVLRRAFDAAQQLLDPDPPWGEVLNTARYLVGADSGTLIVFDNQSRLVNLTAVGFTESCSRDYNSYFYSHDVLERDSRSAPAGTWLDTGQMYSHCQLQRTEFHADFMKKHGMAQISVLVIEASPFFRAAIGFQRSTVDPAVVARLTTGDAARYFRKLRELLALRQRQLLNGLLAVETAFSALDEAICLVSVDGTVVRTSADVQQFFNHEIGFLLRRGVLSHQDPKIQARFASALHDCSEDGRPRRVVIPAGWGRTAVADIGVATKFFGVVPKAVLFVRLVRRSAFASPNVDELQSVFGITPAEAKVLAELAAGHSVAEIAALRRASEQTVRKQVSSLMKKMECNRQSELVKLALMV